MIKDRAYWEAWESRGPLRTSPDFKRALALVDDFRNYARWASSLPPTRWRESNTRLPW
jgi:hypothetical protein